MAVDQLASAAILQAMDQPHARHQHVDAHKTGAQAVERAVAILRCFDGNSGTISLTELATSTQLRTSTAHRIVRALVRGELLEQDPLTERYRLGRAVAILGQAALRGLGLDAVRPDLERLVEASGESASLAVRDGTEVVVVLHVDCNQSLRFAQPTGTRLDVHASAMGKALLAFAGADLKAIVADLGTLHRYTKATITRRTALVDELIRARDQGYAVNLEERYLGVSGVAAPVLDSRGVARAAIGIRGPAVRLDPKRVKGLAPLVIDTAQRAAAYLPLDRLTPA